MAQVFRFGAFELDIERGVLMRDDNGRPESLHVPPQPFRALHYLVERPGRLVARDDLARAIWSHDVFVEQDLGLGHCIRRLRQVLGDEARRPRFIETVPRRGFRFVAEVEVDSDAPEASAVVESATRIAVLPFASHSPHLVEIGFGEGLAEEVLREAFRVAAPEREILALHRSHA
ncbi:MAG: winged helix-turn-helix domain-containing protein, partial [Acidobacteriota bacterium]